MNNILQNGDKDVREKKIMNQKDYKWLETKQCSLLKSSWTNLPISCYWCFVFDEKSAQYKSKYDSNLLEENLFPQPKAGHSAFARCGNINKFCLLRGDYKF